MQIKKVAVLTLALAFVVGFFAPVTKADSIQKELETRDIHSDDRAVENTVYTNGLLDYHLGEEMCLGLSEKAIKQLTQEMIVKYKNYNAYYNAVVVYAMPSEFTDYRHLADSLANVNKYADEVLRINPNAFGIYYLRGLVTLRVTGVNGARAVLKDFVMVAKLQPDAAPWLSMAVLYDRLGNKEKALYCRQMDIEFTNVSRPIKVFLLDLLMRRYRYMKSKS